MECNVFFFLHIVLCQLVHDLYLGKYEFEAKGSFSTYTINDMCEAPANDPAHWKDPGNIHKV